MKSKYIVEGMTCQGCVTKVESSLLKSGIVEDLDIKLNNEISTINLKSETQLSNLQSIISTAGNYTIKIAGNKNESLEEANSRSWIDTYWPILLIFFFVSLVSGIVAWNGSDGFMMRFMQYFMAGFFIAFSFFKFLDIKGFADAYQSYDLLAAKWKGYGFIYPFLELGLGIAYLTSFQLNITYIATIILMGFGSIGVILSVLNKTKIKCACLGTVFNLPMSTVTIVEDLLMVAMAGAMLVLQ